MYQLVYQLITPFNSQSSSLLINHPVYQSIIQLLINHLVLNNPLVIIQSFGSSINLLIY